MGFIDDFKLRLENFANGSSVDRQGKTGDGQIDRFEKASLFNNKELLNELKTACEEDQSVQQQVQSDLGMSLSFIKTRINELTEVSKQRRVQANVENNGEEGNGVNSDGNGININITFNNNWYININVSNDTKDIIEALLKTFTENMQNISNEFFNKLVDYFNKKEDNFKEFLIGMFNKLYDNSGTSIELLQNIVEQLKKMGLNIANMDQAIQDLLKVQIDMLKTENYNSENIEKLVALVTENNNETQEQNKKLGLIYDALINLTDQQKTYFNEIIARMDNSKESYEQIIALLEAIKKENSENQTKLLELVKKFDEHNTEQNTAIINAINEFGIDFAENFDKLIEIGKKNNELQEETNALIKEILNTLNNLKLECPNVTVDVSAIVRAINANGADLSSKLSDLSTILTTINGNIQEGNENDKIIGGKILDAIAKLGLDITEALKNIVVKLDPEKLDALINLIEKFNKDNSEENKAILEAIAGLGEGMGDILEALKNLDVKVTVEGGGNGGTTDLSAVIRAINANGADLSSKLSDLMTMLTTLNGNVIEGNADNKIIAQRILDAIANVGKIINNNGQPMNLDEIMAILRDILDAIKDHTVNIYIYDDGTVNCDGGVVHEGENNDWNNVLNAKRRVAINNEQTGISSVKTDSKDAPIFDLSGVKVSGPLQPGKIYIQNGKKFVAK